jgi:hypothetical protein
MRPLPALSGHSDVRMRSQPGRATGATHAFPPSSSCQFWVNPSWFQAKREVAGGMLWDWIRSARERRAQSAAAF